MLSSTKAIHRLSARTLPLFGLLTLIRAFPSRFKTPIIAVQYQRPPHYTQCPRSYQTAKPITPSHQAPILDPSQSRSQPTSTNSSLSPVLQQHRPQPRPPTFTVSSLAFVNFHQFPSSTTVSLTSSHFSLVKALDLPPFSLLLPWGS